VISLRRIRSSWAKIQYKVGDLTLPFFQELFRLNPKLEKLFKDDVSKVRALGLQLKMLDKVIEKAPDLSELTPALHQLGVKHAKYGVKFSDYDLVKQALMHAYTQVLGNEFDSETRRSWENGFDIVADIMKRGVAVSVYARLVFVTSSVAEETDVTAWMKACKNLPADIADCQASFEGQERDEANHWLERVSSRISEDH